MTRSICSKALLLILFITWPFSIIIGQTGTVGNRNIMIISSKSFQHEGLIPARYTCTGFNISPDISWSGNPRGTRSSAAELEKLMEGHILATSELMGKYQRK